MPPAGPPRTLVWLASYPKSGNTWARIFLSNYLFNHDAPMPINDVRRLGVSDAAVHFYRKAAGGAFDQSDHMQALHLRGRVLRGIAGNGAQINFLKTHNARVSVFGVELIPPRLTRSAVYILRDPRDVAVSYARHFGKTLEAAVAALGTFDNSTAGRGESVKQFLMSWSVHVTSWTRAADFPVLALRYEDMQRDPQTTFARLLEHVGIPVEAERLERAIRFSAFDELRRQEDREPFAERSFAAERFFHTGTSGQWREQMPAPLVERLCRDHGAVMRAFGYLEG
jgi:hypothetical protein